MNLEELEKPIQDIIKLVEKFDEKYREKCFEILLDVYLQKKLQLITEPKAAAREKEMQGEKEEFTIPIDVRAFFHTHNVPEECLQKLFLLEKKQIRPVYKISTTKKSKAQIQIALLTALENALRVQGNKFEFSMEDVRQKCKNRAVYDTRNFKSHFKNNRKYFTALADEEHIDLSPEGRTELAEVILAVIKK